jgi:hypothetical protein
MRSWRIVTTAALALALAPATVSAQGLRVGPEVVLDDKSSGTPVLSHDSLRGGWMTFWATPPASGPSSRSRRPRPLSTTRSPTSTS